MIPTIDPQVINSGSTSRSQDVAVNLPSTLLPYCPPNVTLNSVPNNSIKILPSQSTPVTTSNIGQPRAVNINSAAVSGSNKSYSRSLTWINPNSIYTKSKPISNLVTSNPHITTLPLSVTNTSCSITPSVSVTNSLPVKRAMQTSGNNRYSRRYINYKPITSASVTSTSTSPTSSTNTLGLIKSFPLKRNTPLRSRNRNMVLRPLSNNGNVSTSSTPLVSTPLIKRTLTNGYRVSRGSKYVIYILACVILFHVDGV